MPAGAAQVRSSSSSSISDEGKDEESAATSTTAGAGLSATFKATLDYWRAGGHRTLHRVPTSEKNISFSAADVAGAVRRAAPAPSVTSAVSSQTTASKYMKPSTAAREYFCSGGAGTRPSNTITDTLTSTSVTTTRSSPSPSSASSSSAAREDRFAPRPAPSAPWVSRSQFTHPHDNSANTAAAAARARNYPTSSSISPAGDAPPFRGSPAADPPSTPTPLPHPSTVPSLSARLAVLRATDAVQRSALLQRDGANLANQSAGGGRTDDRLNDRFSPSPYGGRYTEVQRHKDPRDAVEAAFRREEDNSRRGPFHPPRPEEDSFHRAPAASAVVDTPLPYRTSPYRSHRPPFSPPPLQSSDAGGHHHNHDPRNAQAWNGEDGDLQCGTCGINASRDSNALVRSSDGSRVNSPSSAERRTRREARQDETNHIVDLALARQAAAEEAWRESQHHLRPPPPRPRSLSPNCPSLRQHTAALVPTSPYRRHQAREGGRSGGSVEYPASTALLDAMQARLAPYAAKTAMMTAADDEDGALPMQEELAVRAKLAARRSGEGAQGVSDRPEHHSTELQLRQRQQQDHYPRLGEVRGTETARQQKREVERPANVPTDAPANIPASEAKEGGPNALEAVRAHAVQLERLRQRMQRMPAPANPASAQPTKTNTTVSEKPAAALRDVPASASSASSLNIPEVPSSSGHRSLLADPALMRTQQHRGSSRDATTRAAATPDVPTRAAGHPGTPLPERKMTKLSTAAALTATSVEVDSDAEGEEAPLSGVSASSLDDREPTPERVVAHTLKRTSPAEAVVNNAGDAAAASRQPNAVRRLQNDGDRGCKPTKAAPLRGARTPSANATQYAAWLSQNTNSDSDDADAEDASQHDWASATQLPPARPPRAAPPPPSGPTAQPEASAYRGGQRGQPSTQPTQQKSSPTAAGAAEVAAPSSFASPADEQCPQRRSRTPVPSSYAEEMPSPPPAKPPTSDARLPQGAEGSNTQNRTPASDANTLNKLGEELKRAPTMRATSRPSLPIEDAERDIVSSSPSAGRQQHRGSSTPSDNDSALDEVADGGGGAWTPARLAAIQSTLLHVSPTRGTAWQDGFISAHHNNYGPSASSLSSSSSSSLPDYGVLSPFAPPTTTKQSAPQSQPLLRSASPSNSLAHGPSSPPPTKSALNPPAPATAAVAAAAATSSGDPTLAYRRAVRHEANRRAVLRAQALLMEHGVSVEVQLAGRRLPAAVKLSKDKKELLFFLERMTEISPPLSSSSTPRARSLVTPPPSSRSRPQPLLPGGARGPMPDAGHWSTVVTARATGPESSVPSSSPRRQRSPVSPRQQGALYSVAPSVLPRRGGGDDGRRGPPLQPKLMAGPPPPNFVKLPPSAVRLPSNRVGAGAVHFAPTNQPQHPPGRFNSAPLPPQVQRASPARFRTPAQSNPHPTLLPPASDPPLNSRAAAPSSSTSVRGAAAVAAAAARTSRTPSPESTALRLPTPPRTVHVRELHHFPCRHARVYVPYGVMGYEEDSGFGGPGTWEDVSGILCGPASYEVLRRYSCPLFAKVRGGDYVPYRVFVIIPEFQRIDLPQDAVLLVLDFRQRADWVLFLLAVQPSAAGHGGDLGTTARDGMGSPTAASRSTRTPVLSYGRALWMLAVQRLQRARALRGLNPFESRTQTSPPQQRRGRQLRTEDDGEERGQVGSTDSAALRSKAGATTAAVQSGPSSAPSSSPSQTARAPADRTASPGAAAASLRFAAPAATTPASSLLPRRSPLRSDAMQPRVGWQSGQPGRSSLRRVPLPAAAAPSGIPRHQRSDNDPQVVAPPGGAKGLRREGARPRTATQGPSPQGAAFASAPPVDAGDTADASPLYAEEKSTPRFRLLRRVANSLSSSRRSRRSSAPSKQSAAKAEN
ncbi:hypothetical protein ABB37_06108 [Leptomonas pyrrhocoris]|uniref:Uncharacterized protein n=1 Tax=Leptomonas pyrrhocoris TaxID=157538 RepID=A0A0N0VEI9_LEPPY|nr:hypothetical protein ABB37_06108 [Leptomonas pyrrhocoris]KPA78494.1 hypothetical protein ABB37_06108 [Leptomonas pyrrhocoris]|eukprot:XP_015656933.1 hypothetical protein ABB37_06108 [Leptomonas pyrrhocoris]